MISSEDQITTTWLAARLEQFGFGGNVVGLTVTPAHTHGKSKVFHLCAAYRQKADAPEMFFLKLLNHAKAFWFHTAMAGEMVSPPLIPIYGADFDFNAGKGYLLMANLSGSHYQTEWPLPPSINDCRAALDVLARFHAHWWQHPRLEGDLAGWVSERRWQMRLLETAGRIDQFLDFLADRISTKRRKIYRRLAERWPEIVSARQTQRPLTLTHCDAHAWNFFFPHDRQTGRAVLFDWTNWDISTATDDLAHFLGLHWYPAQRAEHEEELLKEYHRRLTAYRVEDYPWEACREDYRRSILRAMLIPAWQWEVGISPNIWWPHLERGLQAYEDLGCEDLLG